MRTLALVAAIAGSASAAPKGQYTVDVKNVPVNDVVESLRQQGACMMMGAGVSRVTLALKQVSLWEVLAALETQNIHARVGPGTIIFEPPNRTEPAWNKEWRSLGPWATTLTTKRIEFGSRTKDGEPRLILIGEAPFTPAKIAVDKAVADGKPVKVDAAIPTPGLIAACRPVELALTGVPAGTTKLTLRGTITIKRVVSTERRVAVPLDDSVVDIAEGRLRIHVASKPATNGYRELYVGWDSLGDTAQVSVAFVDDKGVPIKSGGGGSGSGGSQGHQSQRIIPSGKVFAVLKLPSGKTAEESVPFVFDNEPLSAAGGP